MSTETPELPSPASRPVSPSRESTFSGFVDPSTARMRILVAPYYSPYVVSVQKVQTWEVCWLFPNYNENSFGSRILYTVLEALLTHRSDLQGLILMLQRLFGPTFCSLTSPPKITLHRDDEPVTSDNWPKLVSADLCIVVHTKSEEPTAQQSPRPATSGSAGMKEKLSPKSKEVAKSNATDISGPTTVTPRDPRGRLVNRHANSGFNTPNLFDERNYTPGVAEQPPVEKPKKRKRKGSWWENILSAISGVVHSSSNGQQQHLVQKPFAVTGATGPVTLITASRKPSLRKKRPEKKSKGKRTSRVIAQGTVGSGRPVSMVRSPLKSKFSAGNIMRTRKKAVNKRRSILPPQHQKKGVQRHMARSGSDCSTCFCDDENRDSLVIAPRHVQSRRPNFDSTPSASDSASSSPNLQKIDFVLANEKTDSVQMFTSPIIEEFSLQPKKKVRPPSSACATKTSSIYYGDAPPPIPKRFSTEELGINAQFKILDEKVVRKAVDQVVAQKKAEKVQQQKQESRASSKAQASRSSSRHQSTRSSMAYSTPKRSSSMGPMKSPNINASGLRRSGTTSYSKSGSANASIDSYYQSKHSSNGSRPVTLQSAGSGSRSSSSMGFRRQSTPFDNVSTFPFHPRSKAKLTIYWFNLTETTPKTPWRGLHSRFCRSWPFHQHLFSNWWCHLYAPNRYLWRLDEQNIKHQRVSRNS